MVDHLTKKERSALMSKVRSKHTKPEIAVRKFVWGAGFRYRLHVKNLPGTPDLVFKRNKKAVFVHGCFWHGHKCRINKLPKTRRAFWKDKITRNKARDIATTRLLKREGWDYFTVWECEIKKPHILKKLLAFLSN